MTDLAVPSTATVVCATCGADVPPAEACAACHGPTALEGRYRLLAVLGQGANGTTYRAERLSDGQPVAIKELLVRRLDSVKAMDLFAREAKVLETLEHPGVPRYYEDFTAGSGKTVGLYLVQELIEGETLQSELARRRFREDEVLLVMADVLDILAYLHGVEPPVVHRDIKPANVMRRRDGRLALIDFGAVRDVVRGAEDGSTIAGTFGYMAPEQFAGRAEPASDLYSVAVLAVALLSRRDPQDLVGPDHRLAWQDAVDVSPELAVLLSAMLRPDPRDRPRHAGTLAERARALARGDASAVDGLGAVAVRSARPLALPPAPPRPLPAAYAKRFAPLSGFHLTFGAIFASVGGGVGSVFLISGLASGEALFALIGGGLGSLFLLVGLGFLRAGFRKRTKVRRVLTEGEVTVGEVVDTGYDTSIRVNGRSPYQLAYRVRVDGRVYDGRLTGWDPHLVDRQRGEEVPILYLPSDPAANVAIVEPW